MKWYHELEDLVNQSVDISLGDLYSVDEFPDATGNSLPATFPKSSPTCHPTDMEPGLTLTDISISLSDSLLWALLLFHHAVKCCLLGPSSPGRLNQGWMHGMLLSILQSCNSIWMIKCTNQIRDRDTLRWYEFSSLIKWRTLDWLTPLQYFIRGMKHKKQL